MNRHAVSDKRARPSTVALFASLICTNMVICVYLTASPVCSFYRQTAMLRAQTGPDDFAGVLTKFPSLLPHKPDTQ
jgi:hypothetical protein